MIIIVNTVINDIIIITIINGVIIDIVIVIINIIVVVIYYHCFYRFLNCDYCFCYYCYLRVQPIKHSDQTISSDHKQPVGQVLHEGAVM